MEARRETQLVDSLRTGFIDASVPSDARFAPKLLTNDPEERTDVLSTLKAQLGTCSRFDFSVAFITASGIETIVQLLLVLRENNIPGRILTTTFNNFNDPEALRKLLEFPNIEVRVFEGNLHTKGYFFNQGEINAMVIGSANLTQAALCSNKEWSVLLHSFDQGEIYQSLRREYELLWQSDRSAPLSGKWIDAYSEYRAVHLEGRSKTRPVKPFSSPSEFHDLCEVKTSGQGESFAYGSIRLESSCDHATSFHSTVQPNAMQRSALRSLATLHAEGAPRALLISATGTGKTYLSAFDVQVCRPRRVLFLAHRKRILEASMESFKTVLGNSYSYGIYPQDGWRESTCLFAMVGNLGRHLCDFNPLDFDYVVVDETHRAGASSYQSVLGYFAPRFILGMTATPERGDGYDIFKLFNHVIAYRITLQDALEEDMLAPFHYYGIADLTVDDESQDDVSLFQRLTCQARVDHVIAKIEDYSVSKEHRRGLVFCSRKEEAHALSREFNERGYRTEALCGEDSDEVRNRTINQLEAGELQYIFSVDILNEGVDIPTVNQIIMLRPTESIIVFVQQLGRGLRKAPAKESTLVLDFIGNYQNSYLVSIALSGDRTYNKDNLRRFVKEGSSVMPGCSTISFDRIAESKIFEKLDAASFSESKLIKSEYGNLKMMLGRIPTLADFDAYGAIDPLLIFEKFGSYHAFLSRHERDYRVKFDKTRTQMLRYVSEKLANAKRAEELLVLKALLSGEESFSLHGMSGQRARSVAANLTNGFTLSSLKSKYADSMFVERRSDRLFSAEGFRAALQDGLFREQMVELIDFALSRYERDYSDRFKDTAFVLYRKYTLEDVCRLLDWRENCVPLNVGGYKFDEETNTFPVFINYNKAPDISEATRYEDRFVSDRKLIAISKQPRRMNSPEIVRLMEFEATGMQPYLFVRKNKDDKDGGKEFYFLGTMHPTQEYRPIEIGGKPAVEIGYELDAPVRADIYDYLTDGVLS